MKNKNYIRKTFVRQLSHDDCGIASLCMILKYCCRGDEIGNLRLQDAPVKGTSLMDLQRQAEHLGMTARCVRMDLNYLRQLNRPCILHMINEHGQDHFQVCYGSQIKKKGIIYLIGDPSTGFTCMSEYLLDSRWPSGAALYFDDLPMGNSIPRSRWGILFSLEFFPKVFWISLPLLNIFTVMLGMAISWVVQRGMTIPLSADSRSVVISVLIFLFLITLFKSLLAYVRERILITLNTMVYQRLLQVYQCFGHKLQLSEIHKVQIAISTFVATVISEGTLIVLTLSGLFYMDTVMGLSNLVYLGITGILTFIYLPALSQRYAHLNELAGFTTQRFNDQTVNISASYEKYTHDTKETAIAVSKIKLYYEFIGVINLMIVFAYGIFELSRESIDYNDFIVRIVLSYFITALMPKICNGLFIMNEGAEAALRYFPNGSGDMAPMQAKM